MSLSISKLSFEHHLNAFGIAESEPRISWRLQGDVKNWTQSAFDVEIRRDQNITTNRFHVESSVSIYNRWPDTPLGSAEQAFVRAKCYGQKGQTDTPWSDWVAVETGLMEDADWTGTMNIGADRDTERDGPKAPIYFRKSFTVNSTVKSARLYITAQGLYEAEINGQRVGDHVLAPGWQSYNYRHVYDSYDVTSLVHSGSNGIGILASEGWFNGLFFGYRNIYGNTIGVYSLLVITLQDGRKIRVPTDTSWTANLGPLTASEIYNGETFDSRLESKIDGWSSGSFDSSGWLSVKQLPAFKGKLTSPDTPPTRRIQEIKPQRIFQSASNKTLVDFGQNLAGWLKLTVNGQNGQRVTLRHAEVLENGELALRPLRGAAAADTFILHGNGTQVLEPRFTTHGFRFAQVDGWPGVLDDDSIRAVVVHSDMERTGWFKCSDKLLTKLHENVLWSMKGNFVSIPTDCPQRDERVGWTGDAHAFGPTSNFLYNAAGFWRGWHRDLWSEMQRNGSMIAPFFTPVIPPEINTKKWNPSKPAAVWGDVAVAGPFNLHRAYGDDGMLGEQFPQSNAWLSKGIPRNSDGLWDRKSFQYGDWLDPLAPADDPGAASTSKYLVADAYLIRMTEFAAHMSAALGNANLADTFRSQRASLINKFRSAWFIDGDIANKTQTAYTLGIEFGLFPEGELETAGKALRQLAAQANYSVGTGFAGTPLLGFAFRSINATDDFYRMLLRQEVPSWLYQVAMGATTTWERWDSLLPNGKVNPGEMTSFNHYAFGSVANWMHQVIGGMEAAEPGWKRMRIAPKPGATITSANTRHLSPYGDVGVNWSRRQTHWERLTKLGILSILALFLGGLILIFTGINGLVYPEIGERTYKHFWVGARLDIQAWLAVIGLGFGLMSYGFSEAYHHGFDLWCSQKALSATVLDYAKYLNTQPRSPVTYGFRGFVYFATLRYFLAIMTIAASIGYKFGVTRARVRVVEHVQFTVEGPCNIIQPAPDALSLLHSQNAYSNPRFFHERSKNPRVYDPFPVEGLESYTYIVKPPASVVMLGELDCLNTRLPDYIDSGILSIIEPVVIANLTKEQEVSEGGEIPDLIVDYRIKGPGNLRLEIQWATAGSWLHDPKSQETQLAHHGLVYVLHLATAEVRRQVSRADLLVRTPFINSTTPNTKLSTTNTNFGSIAHENWNTEPSFSNGSSSQSSIAMSRAIEDSADEHAKVNTSNGQPWLKAEFARKLPFTNDQAVKNFMDKYVIYPCNETSSPGFLEHLPCMFKEVNIKGRYALRWAVQAAANADALKDEKNSMIVRNAFKYYGLALNALGESLAIPGKVPDDYDLMTVVILDIFEQKQQLAFDVSLSPEEPDVLDQINDNEPFARLERSTQDFKHTCKRAQELLEMIETERQPTSTIVDMVQELHSLDQEAVSWRQSSPWSFTNLSMSERPDLQALGQGIGETIQLHPDVWMAYEWNYHRAARILFLQKLLCCANTAIVTPGLQEDEESILTDTIREATSTNWCLYSFSYRQAELSSILKFPIKKMDPFQNTSSNLNDTDNANSPDGAQASEASEHRKPSIRILDGSGLEGSQQTDPSFLHIGQNFDDNYHEYESLLDTTDSGLVIAVAEHPGQRFEVTRPWDTMNTTPTVPRPSDQPSESSASGLTYSVPGDVRSRLTAPAAQDNPGSLLGGVRSRTPLKISDIVPPRNNQSIGISIHGASEAKPDNGLSLTHISPSSGFVSFIEEARALRSSNRATDFLWPWDFEFSWDENGLSSGGEPFMFKTRDQPESTSKTSQVVSSPTMTCRSHTKEHVQVASDDSSEQFDRQDITDLRNCGCWCPAKTGIRPLSIADALCCSGSTQDADDETEEVLVDGEYWDDLFQRHPEYILPTQRTIDKLTLILLDDFFRSHAPQRAKERGEKQPKLFSATRDDRQKRSGGRVSASSKKSQRRGRRTTANGNNEDEDEDEGSGLDQFQSAGLASNKETCLAICPFLRLAPDPHTPECLVMLNTITQVFSKKSPTGHFCDPSTRTPPWFVPTQIVKELHQEDARQWGTNLRERLEHLFVRLFPGASPAIPEVFLNKNVAEKLQEIAVYRNSQKVRKIMHQFLDDVVGEDEYKSMITECALQDFGYQAKSMLIPNLQEALNIQDFNGQRSNHKAIDQTKYQSVQADAQMTRNTSMQKDLIQAHDLHSTKLLYPECEVFQHSDLPSSSSHGFQNPYGLESLSSSSVIRDDLVIAAIDRMEIDELIKCHTYSYEELCNMNNGSTGLINERLEY
ncbi:alfa-L-rhamnosidase [Paramyrothecium foliicola]|nr:alfa-L-rhamnosidase [Paramyrothecium foliicola]